MVLPFILRNKKFILLWLLFYAIGFNLYAQNDSIGPLKLTTNGYVETYYLYDFTQPSQNLRPNFYVSHNRHNEFSLNVGMIRFAAENSRVKTAFGLMTGSYVNANLANEPDVLKNIYEGNVSVKLKAKKNLWLQVGIFNSHIGFESAIGIDCNTLSRSIAADNSPYYESGARLNYQSKNEQWFLSFLVLNGWQKMQRLKNNSMPSFGTQVTYTKKGISFNSSNYFGNEGTDLLPVWRYFHNFYLIKKLGSKSSFILGLDAGMQQSKVKSNPIQYWLSPQMVFSYKLTPKFDLTYRIENFYDKDAAVTVPLKHNILNVLGQSINFDYKIISNVIFRLEFKQLYNQDPIFETVKSATRYNSSIAGALAVKF